MNYVLLINGDETQRELVGARFDGAAIPYRMAASEHEAILALQEDMPAMIVWDWPTQDMPAEIFLALLRQEGFCGSVLLCAPTLQVDGVPFDYLLQKPLDTVLLTTTVSNVLLDEAGRYRRRFCEANGA
jgi:DNA-binding NtrC family response regulator